MEFLPQIADAGEFASPRILALPVSKKIITEPMVPWGRADLQALMYNRARSALFHVASVLGDSRVWLPAYHCPALVEPFLAAGKVVSFFPVAENLEPDEEFLGRLLAPGDVIVMIRYFGFECGVQYFAKLCEEGGCVLIEDLAHAPFFDRILGELAVTSLAKCYPVRFGAELFVSPESRFHKPLKSLHDKLPGRVREIAAKVLRRVRQVGGMRTDESTYRYFNMADMSRNIRKADELLISRQPRGPIVERRRSNYRYLAESLSSASAGDPLFPKLGENVVPYVFPFLLKDDSTFAAIRRSGIQIYRWEEMAMTCCEISKEYRHRLVQLPCHQELADAQIDEIIAALK